MIFFYCIIYGNYNIYIKIIIIILFVELIIVLRPSHICQWSHDNVGKERIFRSSETFPLYIIFYLFIRFSQSFPLIWTLLAPPHHVSDDLGVLQASVGDFTNSRKHTKTFANTYKHTKTFTNTYNHTKTFTNTYKHTKTFTHTYKHTKTFTHTYKHTKTFTNTYKHTKTFTNTYKHTKTFTNNQEVNEAKNSRFSREPRLHWLTLCLNSIN